LHANLDQLVTVLADLNGAMTVADAVGVGKAAVAFAGVAMQERFFALRRPPEDWQKVLSDWVAGTPFGSMLYGRKTRAAQSIQAFIHDGVIFRLVWAAEAVRSQAASAEHPRAGELGDGPALAFTYGVPSIPAALLCQSGLDSRTGAVWATRHLSASFSNFEELRAWRSANEETLDDASFWETADQHLLWRQSFRAVDGGQPKPWRRDTFLIRPTWRAGSPPTEGTRVRVFLGGGPNALISGLDLYPLGWAVLPRAPNRAALDAYVTADGGLQLTMFAE
jgi:hypothetical protein